MGRDIKFDYILKNNVGFHHKKYTLNQIESGLEKLFDIENYKFVAKRQFTGLHDKNGVEIYEGDILSEKWKTEVYKNIEGTYMIRFHTNPKDNKPLSLYTYIKKREKAGTADRDCIIIGNIHQNSSLLNE